MQTLINEMLRCENLNEYIKSWETFFKKEYLAIKKYFPKEEFYTKQITHSHIMLELTHTEIAYFWWFSLLLAKELKNHIGYEYIDTSLDNFIMGNTKKHNVFKLFERWEFSQKYGCQYYVTCEDTKELCKQSIYKSAYCEHCPYKKIDIVTIVKVHKKIFDTLEYLGFQMSTSSYSKEDIVKRFTEQGYTSVLNTSLVESRIKKWLKEMV